MQEVLTWVNWDRGFPHTVNYVLWPMLTYTRRQGSTRLWKATARVDNKVKNHLQRTLLTINQEAFKNAIAAYMIKRTPLENVKLSMFYKQLGCLALQWLTHGIKLHWIFYNSIENIDDSCFKPFYLKENLTWFAVIFQQTISTMFGVCCIHTLCYKNPVD